MKRFASVIVLTLLALLAFASMAWGQTFDERQYGGLAIFDGYFLFEGGWSDSGTVYMEIARFQTLNEGYAYHIEIDCRRRLAKPTQVAGTDSSGVWMEWVPAWTIESMQPYLGWQVLIPGRPFAIAASYTCAWTRENPFVHRMRS